MMAPSETDPREKEEILHILREIRKSPEMTQRELSHRLGISLGKINFLLKALIDKGLVKVENFRTSTNKRAYLYVLTPRGIEARTRSTYIFLKRKIEEHARLEAEIRLLQEEAREGGILGEGVDKDANRL